MVSSYDMPQYKTYVHTAIFKVDNQQGPTVEHRELCSMLRGSLDGRGVWGRMDTCIRMAESLLCSPETTTALLIGYTPVQNEKFKVWEKTNLVLETKAHIVEKIQW